MHIDEYDQGDERYLGLISDGFTRAGWPENPSPSARVPRAGGMCFVLHAPSLGIAWNMAWRVHASVCESLRSRGYATRGLHVDVVCPPDEPPLPDPSDVVDLDDYVSEMYNGRRVWVGSKVPERPRVTELAADPPSADPTRLQVHGRDWQQPQQDGGGAGQEPDGMAGEGPGGHGYDVGQTGEEHLDG